MLGIAQCPLSSTIFSFTEGLISALEKQTFNPNPRSHDNRKAQLRRVAQRILAFKFKEPDTSPSHLTSTALPLTQGSTTLLALTWTKTYKLFARQAIEREDRVKGRRPQARPSPTHLLALNTDQVNTIKSIIETLYTRLTGVARQAGRLKRRADAMGNPFNPITFVKSLLHPLALISPSGELTLHREVAVLIQEGQPPASHSLRSP